MGSSQESWTLNAILPRALRIAVGAALFAAVLIVLGSAGAFASSGSGPASVAASQPALDKGKGLLSGMLSPVADVVDKAASQVPVVKDIIGSDTVGKVVAPVSTVTDKVERVVTAAPVVGSVVAPVRQVTNAVVSPVFQAVDAAASPIMDAVDQATAPVVQVIAPVLDPVTGTVRPVVDGVTDGVADVVDNVVVPVLPSTPLVPVAPSLPEVPATLETPGTSDADDTPGGPDVGNAIDSSHSQLSNSASAVAAVKTEDAKSGRQQTVLDAQTSVGKFGALTPYLAGGNITGASTPGESATFVASAGGQAAASCGSNSQDSAVGPCVPAVASASVSGSASGSSAGGSGGSAGPVSANEHMHAQFALAGGAAALPGADWPLPASTPENPGSTPG